MAIHIKVCATESEWAESAANEVCRLLELCPTTHRLLVCLAGGTTPLPVFERLASEPWRDRIPWSRVCWGWGDERWVPPDHAQSNFRLAWETFLSKVVVSNEQVQPIQTVGYSMEDSAREYERVWREWLADDTNTTFALAILGIGTDGHTASLFPNSPVLKENVRWVSPAIAPQPPHDRITLTLPLLNQARNVLVLAQGAEKHVAFYKATQAVKGDVCDNLPIELIHPRQDVYWVVDRLVVEG